MRQKKDHGKRIFMGSPGPGQMPIREVQNKKKHIAQVQLAIKPQNRSGFA
jgi:hypothetical protein